MTKLSKKFGFCDRVGGNAENACFFMTGACAMEIQFMYYKFIFIGSYLKRIIRYIFPVTYTIPSIFVEFYHTLLLDDYLILF